MAQQRLRWMTSPLLRQQVVQAWAVLAQQRNLIDQSTTKEQENAHEERHPDPPDRGCDR